ncbi:MAG: hypothetical protein M3Y53_00835 [Thermoproteota archaeon]|nr:hypothetical protein [Thermoproteota archaeon]
MELPKLAWLSIILHISVTKFQPRTMTLLNPPINEDLNSCAFFNVEKAAAKNVTMATSRSAIQVHVQQYRLDFTKYRFTSCPSYSTKVSACSTI